MFISTMLVKQAYKKYERLAGLVMELNNNQTILNRLTAKKIDIAVATCDSGYGINSPNLEVFGDFIMAYWWSLDYLFRLGY